MVINESMNQSKIWLSPGLIKNESLINQWTHNLPIRGTRKNQVTANLNIHFAVVLYKPVTADNPIDMDKPRAASSGKSKHAASSSRSKHAASSSRSKHAASSSKGKGNAKADESSDAESDDAVSK